MKRATTIVQNKTKISLAINHALYGSVIAGSILSTTIFTPIAHAQPQENNAKDVSGIEIIEVTSRKRVENIQNVPSSVQALSSSDLEEQGIENFEDYALLLPSLSFTSAGPGQAQVYMRGAADGGDGNASGSQPSVAIYLDEQPVTAIGRNLDLHIYDIERIEALAGPQSTLFGASSQSGTLRIITNKPDVDAFESGVSVDFSTTKEGEPSHTIEGFVNLPLTDNTAIRVVGWNKHDGGYIDNVAGTHTSALFTNGGELSFVENTNERFVEEDFNTLDNSGLRASLKTEINNDWEAVLTAIYQKQETNGVWYHDPDAPNGEVGDLEVQRFNPETMDDEFTQASLTITGDLGDTELVYAGSLMERDVQFNSDYSDYTDYYSTSWIQYYGCEYYGSATADCTNMMIAYNDDNKYERDTHELRLQSISDSNFQFTIGLYHESSSHDYRQEWVMEGIAKGPDFEQFGVPDLWYLTDQKREDNQSAVFGEFTYDLNEKLSLTLGGRYFENESKLSGTSGYGVIAPGFPIIDVDTDIDDSGSIFKANTSYQLTDNQLIYLTWSEGYRPGGINRDETEVVPRTYKADFVENIELGWKTMSEDQNLRFNGAIYTMSWDDMQLTRYDASFGSPVGLTINVTESSIIGIESDLTYMLTANLRLSAAASYNQAELAEDLTVGNNFSPEGTELPNVPEFKGNISARYYVPVMTYDGYIQATYSYVGERQSDIFKYSGGDFDTDQREDLAAYSITNLSAGIEAGNWTASIYVRNLTDERAELSKGIASWDSTITVNRPRTIGVSFSYLFE
ncbi:TonB-dependent receptor [Thalassotalea sp. PS06]|uniref:TonB-dependent receptor n=1 Tax=Thalassotalea sp. PS06 TaxID=2594005 RepID=UPI0011632AFC|nr:TonB-dependent receptor [Thalassotalea sp. PS06]QDP00222.1 TonB-dependent receptor [Thalassotalea sp. PS06]